MKVTFQESDHSYTHQTGKRFISVTTLIKEFKNPFDAPYWSDYKAIKDEMEARGEWWDYKRKAGSWKQVVEFWRKNPVYIDSILDRKNGYLKAWELKGKIARSYGTAVHKNKEDRLNARKQVIDQGDYYDISHHSRLIENVDFNRKSVYTEVLIYNEEFELAGQADRVDQMRRLLTIKDYKTNEQIDMTPFMNQKMKYPLEDIPDCDYYHYQLQLSTYGWMLEQFGYKIRGLEIEHTRTGKKYHPEYRPDLVTKMLYEYKKRVLQRASA